jgi:hypothetical protein
MFIGMKLLFRIIRKYKGVNEDIIERMFLESPDWSDDEIKRYLDELEKIFAPH